MTKYDLDPLRKALFNRFGPYSDFSPMMTAIERSSDDDVDAALDALHVLLIRQGFYFLADVIDRDVRPSAFDDMKARAAKFAQSTYGQPVTAFATSTPTHALTEPRAPNDLKGTPS